MPRNRQTVPREERVEELLSAATELFLEKGYDGTTVAGICTATGMTRANVYWYYPSKDHVFAAVMNRMLANEIERLDTECADPQTRLIQGLAEMRIYRALHRAMHERLHHSEEVAAAHETFLDWIRGLVYQVVDERGATVDRDIFADTAVTLFEGCNVGTDLPRPSYEMMQFLIDSITSRA